MQGITHTLQVLQEGIIKKNHPQEERFTSVAHTTNLQQSADSPGRNPPPALSRRRGQAVAVGMKCHPSSASVLSGHRTTTAPATIANEPVQWHES